MHSSALCLLIALYHDPSPDFSHSNLPGVLPPEASSQERLSFLLLIASDQPLLPGKDSGLGAIKQMQLA